MNRVLSNKRLYSNRFPSARRASFAVSERNGSLAGKASLSVGVIFLLIFTLFLGGMYIFQVNEVATQGIDMREAEKKIFELEQKRKDLEIKEVELKSMRQIEKETENLNLVDSGAVSYIELDGPVAMR